MEGLEFSSFYVKRAVVPYEANSMIGGGDSESGEYKEGIKGSKATKDNILKDLQRVRGIGPKVAEEYYDKGVRTIKDLATLEWVPMATRLYATYIYDIEAEIPLKYVYAFRTWLEVSLMELPRMSIVEDVILVGANRRGIVSSHDIDILIIYSGGTAVGPDESFHANMSECIDEHLKSHRLHRGTLNKGAQSMEFLWKLGGKVRVIELYYAPEHERGSALLHYTGPEQFNILLRKRANKRGRILSQHGLFKLKRNGERGKLVASSTEEEVLNALGLPMIPPEERDSKDAIHMVVKG